MDPKVIAMVTYRERQIRCISSALEQDPHGIMGRGEEGVPDPQNADPAQRPQELSQSPQWQAGLCLMLPWPDRIGGRGQKSPFALLVGSLVPLRTHTQRCRWIEYSEGSGHYTERN